MNFDRSVHNVIISTLQPLILRYRRVNFVIIGDVHQFIDHCLIPGTGSYATQKGRLTSSRRARLAATLAPNTGTSVIHPACSAGTLRVPLVGSTAPGGALGRAPTTARGGGWLDWGRGAPSTAAAVAVHAPAGFHLHVGGGGDLGGRAPLVG